MKEKWKAIPGYEGIYEVSTLGRVKSINRGRIRKHRIDRYGYQSIIIFKNTRQKTCFVHRLVAITFIPNVNNLPQINHINGIKTDNRVENLEWCTSKQNHKHAMENNLKRGVKVMDLSTGLVHHSICAAQKNSGYHYQALWKMLKGTRPNKTKLRLVDDQCEEMIQAGLYVLDIEVNEEGKRFDDPERAFAAFKECKTTCALIHRDDGMIAEKWLEDDDDGNIFLEEMIYDEQLETAEVYA